MNQRHCLPSAMLLLARSHGRAPVVTDPFIRPLLGQQWLIRPASHFVAEKPLRNTLSLLYLPSVTDWPLEKGTNQGHPGPWPKGGGSSLIVKEGELPVVERKRKFKPLLCFYHSSESSLIILGKSGQKGHRGHYLYSPFKRMLPEIGSRSPFRFLPIPHKREQGRGRGGLESVKCPSLGNTLFNSLNFPPWTLIWFCCWGMVLGVRSFFSQP